MSQYALQPTIDDLWERRETLSSSTKGEARGVVEAVLDALGQRAGAGRGEKRRGLASQPVVEEGSVDVLPPD